MPIVISDNSDNYDIIDNEKNCKSEELSQKLLNNNQTQNKTLEEKNEESIEEMRKKIVVLGLSGISNLGNTCFMNATLQCLSASDLLTFYIIGSPKEESPYKDDLKNGVVLKLLKDKVISENDLKKELDKNIEQKIRKNFKETLTYTYRKLLVIMWNENCIVKPKSFKQILGHKNEMFKGYQQHDSHECLLSIIDQLHEETKTEAKIKFIKMNDEYKNFNDYFESYQNKLNNKNLSNNDKIQLYREHMDYVKNNEKMNIVMSSLYFRKNYLKDNHSVINDIFSGIYITKIKCTKCLNTFVQFEHNTVLALEVPKLSWGESCDFEKCLDDYFVKVDELNGCNKYSCGYCNEHTEAAKQTEFWRSPKRMIVHLKRFIFPGNKINTTIKFPIENLNMEKYFNEYADQKCSYDLYGVIMHHGRMEFGHYVAFTRNPINNKWYHFDDSSVRHVPDNEIEEAIQNHAAYVLFYKKKGE
jgi:ubiquitin carboxyl-terminal hydrolase 8